MTNKLPSRHLQHFGMLVIGCIGILAILAAPSKVSASSQSFYVLKNNSQQGMLMSLTPYAQVVEPSSTQNAKSLVGVIAPPDDTALSQQAGQINVRTDGLANTLVSTLGGNIKVGDNISSSSLLGVGTKLTSSGWIVGTAQASLDSNTKGAIKTTVSDSKGVKHTVYVASVPLLVKVTYYSAPVTPNNQNNLVPSTVQTAANSIAGKHASIVALILSFILLAIGVILSGLVINGAIRGGILAISRQPLSKSIIQRKVLNSFGMAVLILVTAAAGGLLLLRIL